MTLLLKKMNSLTYLNSFVLMQSFTWQNLNQPHILWKTWPPLGKLIQIIHSQHWMCYWQWWSTILNVILFILGLWESMVMELLKGQKFHKDFVWLKLTVPILKNVSANRCKSFILTIQVVFTTWQNAWTM